MCVKYGQMITLCQKHGRKVAHWVISATKNAVVILSDSTIICGSREAVMAQGQLLGPFLESLVLR